MTIEADYHVFGKTVPGTHRVDTGTEFVLRTRTIRYPYFGHKETYADALKVVDQDTVELRENSDAEFASYKSLIHMRWLL